MPASAETAVSNPLDEKSSMLALDVSHNAVLNHVKESTWNSAANNTMIPAAFHCRGVNTIKVPIHRNVAAAPPAHNDRKLKRFPAIHGLSSTVNWYGMHSLSIDTIHEFDMG